MRLFIGRDFARNYWSVRLWWGRNKNPQLGDLLWRNELVLFAIPHTTLFEFLNFALRGR